ncbi:hypothetical protein BH10BAC1_BH10BAC1_03570 [soil metagenome]
MHPTFLTHYYLPDRKPFLNLSSLKEADLNAVLEELRHKTETGENKRMFSDWYVAERKISEEHLKKEFLKKGGIIEKEFPHYFVFGESSIQKSLAKNTKEIRIELNQVPLDKLSFTYPDSMATMVLKDDELYKMPYHGKVFTYLEILEVIKEFGFPKDEIAMTSKFHFPLYIEAQLWSDAPAMHFL